MKIRLRRALALVLAAVAATTFGSAFAAQAALPEQTTSGGALGQYLYYHGHHFSVLSGGTSYADIGLTIDGVLAMDSAHVGQAEAVRDTAYVSSHIEDYIGAGTEQYSGAIAKALLLAQAQRVTPYYHLGGIGLVARLQALETKTGASVGRFSDVSQFGDYSNTFGQSLALIALHRANKTLSAASIGYLEKQQCPNGGFRITMADAPCTDNTEADTDATSMAMQGLLATPAGADRTSRLSKAFYYIKSQVTSSGGIKGGAPTNTPNANSTGLAVNSMVATDHPTYAALGRTYLKNQRFGCRFAPALRGLVGYDGTRRAQALAAGSSAKVIDQDLRTTSQAVLGFSGVPYVSITNRGASSASPKYAC